MYNRTRFCLASLTLALITPLLTRAQIPMSAGSYTQNFDGLGSASANWTNNLTILGWYAGKGNGDATNFLSDTGTSTTGGIRSYGSAGLNPLSDRALGSIGASSTTYTFGVRFVNDTATVQTNIIVTLTGEQWRSGSGATNAQTLAFSYGVSAAPITNSISAASWINYPALNFVSPNLTGAAAALDGNSATNRQVFTSVALTGVSVAPGQELMLRWLDIDDSGFDDGLAIDDFAILFNTVSNTPSAPVITLQPVSQNAFVGDDVTLTVYATGTPAPQYQWQFFGTNLPGATTSSLTLNSVSTNASGDYLVVISNSEGSTNSQIATLTVTVPVPPLPGFSLLTYNVKGNGATNWSTNAPQVQAIARELQYLQPDIITFNEIPWDLKYEMTNFIAAFLPAYHLAVSSGTDGSICSAIATRFSMIRSNKWLDGIDLRSFGYSNANNALDNFTRDLFEAQIAVPGFPRPLHVFTTHLKSTSGTTYSEAAAKRAAEAAAITNFFATNLAAFYPYDPYTLSGDMNDSDTNSLAIQTLVSAPTGLNLTNPKNPVTGTINTYTTATANPSERIDFIFPNTLLISNIRTSQVFRTDKLLPVPANLNSNDCKVASDHLPVLVVFNNPYDKPFQLLTVTRTNPTVTLQWESVFGQPYRVESSTNLTTWSTLANDLVATGANFTFRTNLSDAQRYFRIYRVP